MTGEGKIEKPLVQIGTGEYTPFNLQAEKQQKWQKVSSELATVTDGLGKPIDAGIFETVVALNVLDINTRMSCEGHVDWGTGAPWIDIEAKGGEQLEERAVNAVRKAHEAYEQEKLQSHISENVESLFDEAHKLRTEAQKPHLEQQRKVMTYLDEFYHGREVPYDVRLVIHTMGSGSRIESQGAELQQIAEPEQKQQKLVAYQAEMETFTAFLKQKYFSS